MNTEPKFGAITSSTNPEEIALRVKGLVLSASSVIIFLATNWLGINLNAADVVDIATQLSAVAGAVVTIYGAGLWVLAKFFRQN